MLPGGIFKHLDLAGPEAYLDLPIALTNEFLFLCLVNLRIPIATEVLWFIPSVCMTWVPSYVGPCAGSFDEWHEFFPYRTFKLADETQSIKIQYSKRDDEWYMYELLKNIKWKPLIHLWVVHL